MADPDMAKAAYVLVLVGGILLFVFGLLALLGASIGVIIPSLLPIIGLSRLSYAIVEVICGVIAIIGAKKATVIGWAVVLIIVGLIGGGLGGLLVVIGGIIGFIVAVSS